MLPLFLLLLTLIQTPDAATVYLYRVEEANKIDSRKTKVYLNDKPLLDMPESEFVGFKLLPGQYVVRMKNKATETPLNLEAGKVYFVRVSETAAGMGYRRDLFIMNGEQATLQMRNMKPLQDKNIKDKALEVVKEKP